MSNERLNLREIKNKMFDYIDFFGCDFIDADEIRKSKTRKELADVFDRHSNHLEDMLADAQQHLKNFRKEVGLDII